MIGELLSGSAPPVEFFNPISFLLLASLYGSGAIVARELKIRWKKDYGTLLLLGAAYGILEEGLMVKSFFDPEWMDLGILGTFGRWMGVNWVWTEMLTIYHMVFSITIPIVLVELAYPERKTETWIGNRALKGFTALLAFVTAIGFFLLTPYQPPPLQYLAAASAMCLFIYTAYKLPPTKETADAKKTGTPRRFWLAGLAGSTAFFLLMYVGPHVLGHPLIVMVLGPLLVFGLLRFAKRFSWEGSESSLNRLALVAGALSFMIFLAFMQEFDASRPDNPRGMLLVSVVAILGLLLLKRKLKTKLA